MVLLTITPSMLKGLEKLQSQPTKDIEAGEAQKPDADETTDETTDADEAAISTETRSDSTEDKSTLPLPQTSEPDLRKPSLGAPISHGQVIALWKSLKEDAEQASTAQLDGSRQSIRGSTTVSLETLLLGSRVYTPPPPPKKEPSPEYKALMARLRRDEEARAYDRMVNPDPYTNMATAKLTSSFAQVHRPVSAADNGDDDVTFSDVNRQVMLIFNFLVTMLGVAYALWVLARWWPTPARLFLAMGGSIAVGIAEYGLYAGYVWHLSQAVQKEKTEAPEEVREVVKTWVVKREAAEDRTDKADEGKAVVLEDSTGASGIDNTQARRRKKDTA